VLFHFNRLNRDSKSPNHTNPKFIQHFDISLSYKKPIQSVKQKTKATSQESNITYNSETQTKKEAAEKKFFWSVCFLEFVLIRDLIHPKKKKKKLLKRCSNRVEIDVAVNVVVDVLQYSPVPRGLDIRTSSHCLFAQ
jgi:Leu/Phe-tRNA-protein transferase